jgi:hypothetical protein
MFERKLKKYRLQVINFSGSNSAPHKEYFPDVVLGDFPNDVIATTVLAVVALKLAVVSKGGSTEFSISEEKADGNRWFAKWEIRYL